ncbi:MAG: four helix bundle protein [Ginsengibacter sp.]
MEYTLEKLEVYNMAEDFSDEIWNVVIQWDYFIRDTIGKQLVRAADSISANIAEGYGRYFYKESKQFYFYSRGSIQETKSWLSKCLRRNLIDSEICKTMIAVCETILLKLNAFIKFVRNSQKSTTNKPIN